MRLKSHVGQKATMGFIFDEGLLRDPNFMKLAAN